MSPKEGRCSGERRVLRKSIRDMKQLGLGGRTVIWVISVKVRSWWWQQGADRMKGEKQGMGIEYMSLQLILNHLCRKLPYSPLETAAFQGDIKETPVMYNCGYVGK